MLKWNSMQLVLYIFLSLLCIAESRSPRIFRDRFGGEVCITPREPISCAGLDKITSFRTVTGQCNNLVNTNQGASNERLERLISPQYFDEENRDLPFGHIASTRPDAPSPIVIGQNVFKAVKRDQNNVLQRSDFHWQFGQFLDHDISLTEAEMNGTNCGSIGDGCSSFDSCFPIPCDSRCRGFKKQICQVFARSEPACPKSLIEKRQQPNLLTAYLDASNVYGSDNDTFQFLRDLWKDETRELKSKLLPSVSGVNLCGPNVPPPRECFIAGDIRSNEHFGLTAIHTLFLREHLRIYKELKELNPDWDEDKRFHTARRVLIGVWQNGVFNEFVPTLAKLPKYTGYKDNVNAQIVHAFSTSAFRFGHSEVANDFLQLNANFDMQAPSIPLVDAFFQPEIIRKNGIEPTIFGLLANQSGEVDRDFAFTLDRKLFNMPTFESLPARNIQRGRDHGQGFYLQYRRLFGLSNDLIDIPPKVAKLIRKAYSYKDEEIELFVGGITERPLLSEGLAVGPLFSKIIGKQFEKLRDGDRFYFENPGVFTKAQLKALKSDCLARVFCDNLVGIVSVQPRVMFTNEKKGNRRISCSRIPKLDLTLWKDSAVIPPAPPPPQPNMCADNKFDDVSSDLAMKKNGWIIDVTTTNSNDKGRYTGECNENTFFGYKFGFSVGSVSVVFTQKGVATLSFGNCYTKGTVVAKLNNIVLAKASPRNTVSITFNIQPNCVLSVSEHGSSIIQINSLKTTCAVTPPIACKCGTYRKVPSVRAYCSRWHGYSSEWCYLSGGRAAKNCPGANKSKYGNFYWSSANTIGGVCYSSRLPSRGYGDSNAEEGGYDDSNREDESDDDSNRKDESYGDSNIEVQTRPSKSGKQMDDDINKLSTLDDNKYTRDVNEVLPSDKKKDVEALDSIIVDKEIVENVNQITENDASRKRLQNKGDENLDTNEERHGKNIKDLDRDSQKYDNKNSKNEFSEKDTVKNVESVGDEMGKATSNDVESLDEINEEDGAEDFEPQPKVMDKVTLKAVKSLDDIGEEKMKKNVPSAIETAEEITVKDVTSLDKVKENDVRKHFEISDERFELDPMTTAKTPDAALDETKAGVESPEDFIKDEEGEAADMLDDFTESEDMSIIR